MDHDGFVRSDEPFWGLHILHVGNDEGLSVYSIAAMRPAASSLTWSEH